MYIGWTSLLTRAQLGRLQRVISDGVLSDGFSAVHITDIFPVPAVLTDNVARGHRNWKWGKPPYGLVDHLLQRHPNGAHGSAFHSDFPD